MGQPRFALAGNLFCGSGRTVGTSLSMVRVYVPTPLRSYTGRRAQVEVEGSKLVEVFDELEREYPGIRFRVIDEQDRIREHIRVFVNQERAEGLDSPLQAGDKVQIILAVSGG